MTGPRCKFVLWTGPKHSGKTTAALRLTEAARAAGFSVAGLAAPGVHDAGRLAGFDAVDLATGERVPLARRGAAGAEQAGPFGFLPEGLAAGRAALRRPEAASADLVVVDEFGPLELSGGGWRGEVDALAARAMGLVVLVVRAERVEPVRELYPGTACDATAGDSAVRTVIDMLRG